MNAISSTAPALPTTPVPTPASVDAAPKGDGGGDLLAAMNPAMDAAFAVGRPTNASGAAAILGTSGAYIDGAKATLVRLDEGIERRERELAELRISDPEAATGKAEQLDLLKRLRDRIQLSIERVSATLAGGSESATESKREHERASEQARDKREQLALLEQRRMLLEPAVVQPASDVDPSLAARTYASGPA
jgi:hypothetical protein